MNIGKYLFVCVLLSTASDFGTTAAHAGNCTDALKKVPSLSSLRDNALHEQEDLILQMCSDGPAGRIVRGARYERASDLKNAVGEYRSAVAEITRDVAPDNHIRQGDKHLLTREFGKAIQEYQAALKERPDWIEALLKLADAHIAAGNDDEAIDVLQKCIKLDKNNSAARYTLGVIYEHKGLLTEAEAELRESLRFDPGNGDAHQHLADVYTILGDFPHAIREYHDLLAQRHDNPLLHFKLARAYERSKHYKEAIAEYHMSIKLAPDNVEANKELAMLYHKKRMYDDAVHHYQETLRLKNDDRYSRNALTAIYLKQKKFDALLALLKDETRQFPENPDSHYRLGLMQFFLKDYDAAQGEYQTAVTLKPDHAWALKGLGKIAMIKGDRSQEAEFMLASQKADPTLLEDKELLNDQKEELPFQPQARKSSSKIHKKKHVKSIKKTRADKMKSAKTSKKVRKNNKGKKKQ